MMIRFLGTGSADPSPTRQNLSLLIGSGPELVLVDCSGSPVQTLLKLGHDPSELKHVVLTHTHVDHIYGLPSLIHSLWLFEAFNNEEGISIHGLPETVEVAKSLLDVFNLEGKKNPVRIRWNPVVVGELGASLSVGIVKLRLFEVTHGNVPTVGLEIEDEDKVHVVYSCDSQADSKVANRIKDNTVALIQDCGGVLDSTAGHAGGKDVNRLIRGTDLRDVYLVHFPDVVQEELEAVVRVVQEGFRGSVIIPSDLDTVKLP